MSAPSSDIVIGDAWVTTGDLGIGVGLIPSGSEVEVSEYLEPYSPGVAQSEEWTVVSTYSFTDWGYDDSGAYVQVPVVRRLAYAETTFRGLFEPRGGE